MKSRNMNLPSSTILSIGELWQFFNLSGSLFSISDTNGYLKHINPAFTNLLGYTEEEFLSMSYLALVHPEDIQMTIDFVREVANCKSISFTNRCISKTGDCFWLSWSLRYSDSYQMVYATAQDITEQKQASQYARSLIEASLDPLVTISADGKITDVNEASVKVTGIRREKLIGTDFSNYFTEPEKAREGYRQVFEKGFVEDYPLTIRHKNGKLTDVLYHASVYKDEKGNVLGVFAAARDVTEQKQASQYARSLIEASLDPLVTISADGKITDVNEASVKVTGVSRDILIGTDFSNYFTEPEKARIGYKQVFKKGFVADYPLTIKHIKGTLTDVLYNASVYKDEKGNVLGVFAAARDITKQKDVEKQIQKIQIYTRMLIETSLDPQITKGPDGLITDVNEATILVTGIPRDKIIGTHFPNYFTEPQSAEKAYQEAFSKGVVRNVPLTIKHVSGKATDVLYNATVYKDELGNIQGVFASARDISDRIKGEMELKKSQAYTRSLIEASLDPLVTISADGKITDVNEASVKVTGVHREKLIGTDFSNYFTEPEKAREGYLQVFEKGFVADYPLTIRHKSGKLTDVLYNASVYKDDKGNVLGVFAAARDVTEQKTSLEAITRTNDELKKTNAELDKFVYSVSHDLRAPLTSILGLVEYIELETDNDNVVESLYYIKTSVKKLDTFIQDILDYSRNARLGVKKEKVCFSQILEDIPANFKFMSSGATVRPVQISSDIKNGVLFYSDSQRISIILNNLVSNAIRYANPESQNPFVHISVIITADEATITVKDNGIGIHPKYHDSIFNMFYRVSANSVGSGLGLYIVKETIEKLGGHIHITSEVNKGSTFTITIPNLLN